MRCALVAVVLAGCNPIFDLRPTDLVEYAPIDAPPIDAPPMCPPTATPLVFARTLTQAFAQEVREYTFSTSSQLALAQCQAPYDLCEGRLGDRMSKVVGFAPEPGSTSVGEPRLSAFGDVALVKQIMATQAKFSLYARGPDGAWSFVADTNLPAQLSASASQPTGGPERHVMFVDQGGAVSEWVQTTTWTKVATYTNAELGVAIFFAPRLSGDGLRMTGYGQLSSVPIYRTLYFDRASLADRWNPAVALEGVPNNLTDAMLSEDCSRLYFSALSSVFYLSRVP